MLVGNILTLRSAVRTHLPTGYSRSITSEQDQIKKQRCCDEKFKNQNFMREIEEKEEQTAIHW